MELANKAFWRDGNVLYLYCQRGHRVCLPSVWKVASETEHCTFNLSYFKYRQPQVASGCPIAQHGSRKLRGTPKLFARTVEQAGLWSPAPWFPEKMGWDAAGDQGSKEELPYASTHEPLDSRAEKPWATSGCSHGDISQNSVTLPSQHHFFFFLIESESGRPT